VSERADRIQRYSAARQRNLSVPAARSLARALASSSSSSSSSSSDSSSDGEWSDSEVSDTMPRHDSEDLELNPDQCMRDVFRWARAHLAAHTDGTYARNRDEPRDGGPGDARWKARAISALKDSSFPRNFAKRTRFQAMMGLANIPAVPADRLDGNQAIIATPPLNATMEHIILAFMEYGVEPKDRSKARGDLTGSKLRQGTTRLSEFLDFTFQPAVHIAQLEDSQYTECLIAACNNTLNKKMKADHVQPLATRLRNRCAPNLWAVLPAQAAAWAIEDDNALLTIAQNEPYNLDDYLLNEEKAAAVSEEALAFQKVAAIRSETAATIDELKTSYDKRFADMEHKMETTSAEVKSVDKKVDSLATSVSDLLAGIAALGSSQKETQDLVKGLDDRAKANDNNGNRGGQRRNVQCHYCGKWGHFYRDCKTRKRDEAEE